MTLQCYLIWFRKKGDDHDRIVGTASKWPLAKKMAEDLYAIKANIDGHKEISTGISLFDFGSMYVNQPPKGRWQILPIMSVNVPVW
jgi:hypothetical protein